MSRLTYRKPRLPSHYYVLFEPPDSKGEEVLRFVSERRRITIKGHSFREFQQYVIPLLDGRHTLDDIEAKVADVFRPEDLEAGLRVLADQELLEETPDVPLETARQIEPQTNFFHEVSADPRAAQERLEKATVTIMGLSGAGGSLALALAAARVGTVNCVDALPVGPADPYLCAAFSPGDIGRPRVEVLGQRMAATGSPSHFVAHARPLESDADVAGVVRESDFIACCLDAGQSSLIYKLNRVCLEHQLRWCACSVSGLEVVLGPTVVPGQTACYLCYRMRAVACAADPEADFAFQRMLDRRKQDDSGRRENLNVAAGLAADLLGLEVLKQVSGVAPSPTVGRIAVFDLVELSLKKHIVLRKPWCPACFPQGHEEIPKEPAT
jgi:adenylyltransferase/sulfurtransferase